jgi:hypothetical protein
MKKNHDTLVDIYSQLCNFKIVAEYKDIKSLLKSCLISAQTSEIRIHPTSAT